MSEPSILYLGDTCLSGAAGYLAGLLSSWDIGFGYLPSDQPVQAEWFVKPPRLVVLSDYPASMFDMKLQQRLIEQVAAGTGLLMIGGWESFCGCGGDWAGTPVASSLPVEIQTSDDRVNCDQPALVHRTSDHSIVADLPWEQRPPTIGGFNRLRAKPGARVILEVERFTVHRDGAKMVFEARDRHPLLVVGQHGTGRTAALATDLAPHWVGGLIDWGNERVCAQSTGGGAVEVGSDYARFVRQLITWAGGLESELNR